MVAFNSNPLCHGIDFNDSKSGHVVCSSYLMAAMSKLLDVDFCKRFNIEDQLHDYAQI